MSPSVALEPEFVWEKGAGDRQLRITPFVRFDAHDERRTHFDVREAGALFLGNGWTLFAGVGKVFWGKTEAHHLVDIVNQTDAVEDIDGEDKLGQPMLSATLEMERGAIDVFVLPYFRERTFAGDRGRLRGPLPILESALYESTAERWHTDVAVRWSWFVGELDLGVSAFRGTSREPLLVPMTVDGDAGPTALQPRYDLIDQVSIDAQWTGGSTLWKLEAMTRSGHGDRFGATTFGVEHTLFNLGPLGQTWACSANSCSTGGALVPLRPLLTTTCLSARAWPSTTRPTRRSSVAPSWTTRAARSLVFWSFNVGSATGGSSKSKDAGFSTPIARHPCTDSGRMTP